MADLIADAASIATTEIGLMVAGAILAGAVAIVALAHLWGER